MTAPTKGSLRVQRLHGRGYAVVAPDGQQIGPVHSRHELACNAMDAHHRRRARQRQGKDRPCMCCGAVFRSEGIHNRLCNICRLKSADNGSWGPSLAQARGRRRR